MQFKKELVKQGNSLGVVIPFRVINRLGLSLGNEYTFKIVTNNDKVLSKLQDKQINKKNVEVSFHDDRKEINGNILFMDLHTVGVMDDKLYLINTESIKNVK